MALMNAALIIKMDGSLRGRGTEGRLGYSEQFKNQTVNVQVFCSNSFDLQFNLDI